MDTTDSLTWADVQDLTEAHAEYLATKAAITPAQVLATRTETSRGIRTALTVDDLPEHAQSWREKALPAIIFPYVDLDGGVTEQVKPDVPIQYKDEPKPRKYILETGSGSTLNAVRHLPEAETVLVVEGTKQAFAVASHAPAEMAVYGIAGCRSWSESGVPIPALRVVRGKNVVVIFDADFRSNEAVWEAGEKLGGVLGDEGAKTVKYAKINAGKSIGIDDVLATKYDDEHCREYLKNVIASAEAKLPAKPKQKSAPRTPGTGDVFFDREIGLLVHQLHLSILKKLPAALTPENKIALYRNGYYDIDGVAFSGAVARLLGDRFRPGHRSAVEEYTAGTLHTQDKLLPTYVAHPLLNVSNGMLDLPTSTLKPHDPSYLSSQQVPVAWDPHAQCPTYDRWIESCGMQDQIEDLEEAVSMMLDPSRTPHKAVFLFGPSRSGKSTFLRLMQAMVGSRNYSAVTLHQLAENRFAAANVFGKMLNCAADLSSAHVDDLSIFKMMTGEDPIQADRKFGSQFAFINKALFAFSANEPPTVSEASRAYTARIKPFKFGRSFEGHEDPAMEEEMLAHEMPGILVRWVKAWQRRQARGSYLPTAPEVATEFETKSDRVRQWVNERCTIHTETAAGKPVMHGSVLDNTRCSTKKELGNAFAEWAKENNGSSMGQRMIIARLLALPGVHEIRNPKKAVALNVTVRSDGDQLWPDDEVMADAVAVLVAVTGGETATGGGLGGGFQSETATKKSQVGGSQGGQVAEVAVSKPYSPSTESLGGFAVTEGEKALGDSVSPSSPHSANQTATSATPTDAATPRITPRPGLDKIEKAMEEAGAVQPTLPLGDTPKSSGPQVPVIRRDRNVAPVLGPNVVERSPIASITTDEVPSLMCKTCRQDKEPVPPTNFFYACRHCYPATFGA